MGGVRVRVRGVVMTNMTRLLPGGVVRGLGEELGLG